MKIPKNAIKSRGIPKLAVTSGISISSEKNIGGKHIIHSIDLPVVLCVVATS